MTEGRVGFASLGHLFDGPIASSDRYTQFASIMNRSSDLRRRRRMTNEVSRRCGEKRGEGEGGY